MPDKNSNLVKEITSYPIAGSKKAELHFSAASSNIIAEDFETAHAHLQAAIEVDSANEEYLQANFLTAVLSANKDKIQESFELLDIEARHEVTSAFKKEESPLELTVDFEDVFDPQKIHAHYQSIKAQQLNNLSAFNRDNGWQVEKNRHISISKTIPVKFFGLIYHAHISSDFEKIESYNSFNNALTEKGVAKRAKGQNGVKCLQGKVFEIKINGDLRLYTNKAYLNENGQYLLIFDNLGNHEMVTRFTEATKSLEVIKLNN